KAAAITWVRPSFFLTAGFNTLQERELMLWDVRKLDKAMARERMDTGTGLLMPIFDQDTNLLFVGGRGDKTIRTYELNVEKAPAFTALQPATAGRPTWGMTTLPKRACALGKCEVARVLVLEQGGTIEPISFTVPRRDAATQFQVDQGSGVVVNGHKMPVTDLEFHPFHSALLATASDDGTIRVSDHTKRDPFVTSLDGHTKGVRCVAFHPTADTVLASGSQDNCVKLWDVETGAARQTIDKFEDTPLNLSFNFDGSLVATISRDKTCNGY
ncbi:hypothetical protein DYB28_004451, partial [Aphanomyces astaci]